MSIRVARKRPDAYQHGDLRRALVQAGLKLLAERGVAGLSLRAAAELAGVSHAAPYRHFRDKEALVAAIAEEGFRMLTRHMREEIAAVAGESLLTRLGAAGQGYVSFALSHPAYFRTMFGGVFAPAVKDGKQSSLQAAGQESYDVLRTLVDEGLAKGTLRAGTPDEIALAAWSLVHGLGMLLIDGQLTPMHESRPQVRAITETLLGMIERGLARDPRP
jgi:AcrR family transcriptional regulator